MFLQKRVINGISYKYLDHSFRIGNKVKKASFLLSKNKEEYNERIIRNVAEARAEHFTKNFHTFFSQEEIVEIETEKVFFSIFYNSLNEKSKDEIFSEFMRIFLSNSMELEGSTITPQLAKKIENNKKIILPESEIRLYNNSKEVLRSLLNSHFRSVISFVQFHQKLYQGVYPHAGEFKKLKNTFGYTEKAKTAQPKDVRRGLKNTLEKYKDRKLYPFLQPLLFHLNYQKVHPFTDGNSRLGRILLVVQMFKRNYPALMFKGDMNFQIRETLVEYCNRGNLDFCRLALEQYLDTSRKFWRPMIRKFLF